MSTKATVFVVLCYVSLALCASLTMTQKDDYHSDAETAKTEAKAKQLSDMIDNMPTQTEPQGLSEKQDETLNKMLAQAKDIQRIRQINEERAAQDPTESPTQIMAQQQAQNNVDEKQYERQLARLKYKINHNSANYDSTVLNHDEGKAKPVTTDDMYAEKFKRMKKQLYAMQQMK